MKHTLKATRMEFTKAIVDYVEKKLREIDKILDLKDTSIIAAVEVGLLSKHHKSGEVFFAEINLHAMKRKWRAVAEEENLYAAIDAMKDAIIREVTSAEKKTRTKSRKGARDAKTRLRGW